MAVAALPRATALLLGLLHVLIHTPERCFIHRVEVTASGEYVPERHNLKLTGDYRIVKWSPSRAYMVEAMAHR